jgi:hypothetical protein
MRPLALASFAAALLGAAPAAAAPAAHLLRIDARGAPTLTTVIDLVQPKRIADVTSRCAPLTGDAQLDCLGDALEQPGALYSAFPFPDANAVFSVAVGGKDTPLAFESKSRWGSDPAAGTAWLVVVDASWTMGARLDDAREVASAFIDTLRAGDVVDVVAVNDRGAVVDSKWQSAKAPAKAALSGLTFAYPLVAPKRPLATVVKQVAVDAYKDLATAGVGAPLHQAMVLISDGERGDAASTGPVAQVLRDFLSRGRFPEGGTTPKMPLPVVSIWLPTAASAEARGFMESVANPELGGFFTAVRAGRKGRAPGIVSAVRGRFDAMHLVKWKLTCTVIGPTQSFSLAFNNVTPPIAGDATWQSVPYNGPGPQPCKK